MEPPIRLRWVSGYPVSGDGSVRQLSIENETGVGRIRVDRNRPVLAVTRCRKLIPADGVEADREMPGIASDLSVRFGGHNRIHAKKQSHSVDWRIEMAL
jgi:hypothetical protein